MPSRAFLVLLATVLCGTLALIAADPGAIRTSVSTTTTPPASPPPSAEPDQIWSALVLATNSDNPKASPVQLKGYVPKMKKIFGYNQFEIVGSATQQIGGKDESWLVPSKSVWMGLKGRRALAKEAQGGFLISLQLFQDDRQRVESEIKLAPGSPLYIRGPQYGKGQLIIILEVQK